MSGIKWAANNKRSTYAAICTKVEPLSVLRLTIDRPRYLSRLSRYAPPQLWALIQATADAPDSFVALITSDLAWLHTHTKTAAAECGGAEPLSFWITSAAQNVAAWHKCISIARFNGIRVQNDKLHHDNWANKVDSILPGVGGSGDNPEEAVDRENDYMCECGVVFFFSVLLEEAPL